MLDLNNLPNGNRVGSKCRTEVEAFRALGADIRDQYDREINSCGVRGSLRRQHNLFMLYNVLGLLIMTGIRPVRSPLRAANLLDPATGFVLVNDKAIDLSHAARTIWLVPDLVREVNVVKEYGELISRQISVGREELFFFIDGEMRPRPVYPSSLMHQLKYFWSLPLNAPRHFLASYLAERRVRGDVIGAFLGHWDCGEEPNAVPSMVSPENIRQHVTKPLQELWDAIEWRSLRSPL